MFFLRCAFFLSIVYVSILCGLGTLRSPHAIAVGVLGGTAGAADAVVANATDWCAVRPAQCIRDAARLAALVQLAAAEPVSGSEDVVLAEAETPRALMPVPDPRRRAARAVLTDGR